MDRNRKKKVKIKDSLALFWSLIETIKTLKFMIHVSIISPSKKKYCFNNFRS